MGTIMKISTQGQIRIPKKFMHALGVDHGDYLEVSMKDGHLILEPRKLIDPRQKWYWTSEWQTMEAEVDEQIERNQLSREFETAEKGIEWLKK